MVSSHLDPEFANQNTVVDDPCPKPSLSEVLTDSISSSPETDYGPWLLVSRQRGRAQGRGGDTRASHPT